MKDFCLSASILKRDAPERIIQGEIMILERSVNMNKDRHCTTAGCVHMQIIQRIARILGLLTDGANPDQVMQVDGSPVRCGKSFFASFSHGFLELAREVMLQKTG